MTRFPTSRRPARAATVYCPTCRVFVGATVAGGCPDCESLREWVALRNAPRRHVPRACEIPSPRDRRPDLATIAARAPAAAQPLLAGLSSVLRDVWSLVFEQRLTIGEAARRRGKSQPATTTAARRIRDRFAAAGLLDNSGVMTGSAARDFRKVRPDEKNNRARGRSGGSKMKQAIDVGGHVLDFTGEVQGAVQTSPEVILTPEQAAMQLRMFNTLRGLGLELRSQGDVHGWLLDQLQAKLDAAKPGEIPKLFPPRAAR